MQRERLGSRLGFILLSAGCAIGVGNVWKFPWMVGQYGGGAFVFVYLLFLFVLGLFYLSGLEQWSVQASTALPGVPWNGIVVAFIAQLSPIASIFVSIFISFISQGSVAMSQSIFPAEFGDLITGIIVYLSGLTSIVMMLIAKKKKKKLPLEKKGVEE